VQRWQEAKPLHETGAVSPVPLVTLALHPQARRAETLTEWFDTERYRKPTDEEE